MRALCFLLFAVGCNTHDWSQRAKIPDNFAVKSAFAPSRYVVLLGGYRYEGSPANARPPENDAQILRWQGGEFRSVYRGPGRVCAFEGYAGSIWAIVATIRSSRAGSDYRLLVSNDNGTTWKQMGPVPIPSLKSLVAADAQELWAFGAGPIGRSVDGGTSWTIVEVPDRHSVHIEQLGRTRLLGMALYGEGLQTSSDGGHTWIRRLPPNVIVDAIDVDHLIAISDHHMWYGTFDAQDGVHFERTISLKGAAPELLVVTGDTIRLLASYMPPPSENLTLFESRDGGRSFSRTELGALSRPGTFGLSRDGGGVAIDLMGNVKMPR